ncbi:MAG: T9SS type A sorting domain-containing protein [Flavobacteriales bacterium]|jgi:hypothetical protein|nr:T9SS type A sorting domain-containing protein [Flavobacteriales bacterium]
MKKQYSYWKVSALVVLTFLFSIHTTNAQSCTDPTVSDTDGPGTVCEGSTATLTATHDGEDVNWYDAETGGNLLGTGSPFVTSELSSTSSFWAESVNNGSGTPQTGGGRVAPTNTSSSAVVDVTSPWGLAFDANQGFTINSVDVYLASNTPGDLTVQLKDNGLNILDEITVAAPAGNPSVPVQFAVALDFFVPAGTDYNLVASVSPVMVREFSSGHPGFPYPIGTVGTINGGTINDNDTNSGLYYFFYNWTVTPGEVCTSDRVEEVVTVTPAPDAPTGDTMQTFTAGETLADLDVTGTDLTWYSDDMGTNEIPDDTPLVDGTTYYVSQTVGGCEGDLLAITVSLVLGTEDATLAGLSFSPNPVTSNLQLSNEVAIKQLTVYSILGQELVVQSPNSTNVSIDLSILSAGSYFIRVATETGATTIKILKE